MNRFQFRFACLLLPVAALMLTPLDRDRDMSGSLAGHGVSGKTWGEVETLVAAAAGGVALAVAEPVAEYPGSPGIGKPTANLGTEPVGEPVEPTAKPKMKPKVILEKLKKDSCFQCIARYPERNQPSFGSFALVGGYRVVGGARWGTQGTLETGDRQSMVMVAEL
jgi:hypothetical protein